MLSPQFHLRPILSPSLTASDGWGPQRLIRCSQHSYAMQSLLPASKHNGNISSIYLSFEPLRRDDIPQPLTKPGAPVRFRKRLFGIWLPQLADKTIKYHLTWRQCLGVSKQPRASFSSSAHQVHMLLVAKSLSWMAGWLGCPVPLSFF